jgi:hypothetical protein
MNFDFIKQRTEEPSGISSLRLTGLYESDILDKICTECGNSITRKGVVSYFCCTGVNETHFECIIFIY